jgi:hypothetical protein
MELCVITFIIRGVPFNSEEQKMPPRVIQIFVKVPAGKTYEIQLDPCVTTSLGLKKLIAQSLTANNSRSYQPNQQILSFSGMSTVLFLQTSCAHCL